MSAPTFVRTASPLLAPWLFYDPSGELLVTRLQGVVRAFTLAAAEAELLLRTSSYGPGDPAALLQRGAEQWTERSDAVFNNWFAALFGGMVQRCSEVQLSPRSPTLDMAELTKLNEQERNQRLDRDNDCAGTIDDHVLILCPPLEPSSAQLARRAYRLYHVDVQHHTMVPPKPVLLF